MRPNINNMLVIGTAQISSSYGIVNQIGISTREDQKLILQRSVELGICKIETAALYHNGESLVGELVRTMPSHKISVTTKGSLLNRGIVGAVEASLYRLGLPSIDTWLLHNEVELKEWSIKTSKDAKQLVKKGKVRSIGVSVYHPESAVNAFKVSEIGEIQFPGNIFDRRFFRNHHITNLLRSGKRATVRSVYLQGLCLLSEDNNVNQIPYAVDAIGSLNKFCRRHNLERDAFCMQYVLRRIQGMNVSLLVGVDSRKQLERNIAIFNSAPLSEEICNAWDADWPNDYLELALPQYWPQSTKKVELGNSIGSQSFGSKSLRKGNIKDIQKVQIGKKHVGDGYEPLMFAEEGQANQGDIVVAMSMCEIAAKAGADGIEFQLFLGDDIYAKSDPNHQLYKSKELSQEEIRNLIAFAHSQGLLVQVAGLSPDIIKYCAEEGVDSFCVNATDLTNPVIIDAVAATGLPFWLATLMGSMEEIDWAVNYALSRSRSEIGLLHGQHVMSSGDGGGVPPELLQLDCIDALKKRHGLAVGFVDHTNNVFMPSLAAANGAALIMKHLAPKKDWKGPDWQIALDPDSWRKSKETLKYSYKSRGDSKEISLAEIKDKSLHRRSLYTRKPFLKGYRISEGDLVALRPGAGGLDPRAIHELLGRQIAHDLPEQHQLQLDDLV